MVEKNLHQLTKEEIEFLNSINVYVYFNEYKKVVYGSIYIFTEKDKTAGRILHCTKSSLEVIINKMLKCDCFDKKDVKQDEPKNLYESIMIKADKIKKEIENTESIILEFALDFKRRIEQNLITVNVDFAQNDYESYRYELNLLYMDLLSGKEKPLNVDYKMNALWRSIYTNLPCGY